MPRSCCKCGYSRKCTRVDGVATLCQCVCHAAGGKPRSERKPTSETCNRCGKEPALPGRVRGAKCTERERAHRARAKDAEARHVRAIGGLP